MSCVDEVLDAAKRAGINLGEDEAQEIVAILESKLAKKIMGSQMTRDKKLNEANTTIENSGSENTLQTNIMYYHKNILKKLNEKLL